MKGRKNIKLVGPENHFCLHCALDGFFVEASEIVWDEELRKIVPLCTMHFELHNHPEVDCVDNLSEEESFWTFSDN